MKKTVVLKFGGSSVADNDKLNKVADKIVELYENNNVVVVVSAQGKTTDKLIEEAHSITKIPSSREMDVLLSTGEQITIAKLAILLENRGYSAISLTGWHAGIFTTNTSQNATIENIDISRIKAELDKNKIVIVAGFQGINENLDITTLGRGGSDTTAVALAAAINADECSIFSDVDGIYTVDPNKIPNAIKLDAVSYSEMLEMAGEGAKVLHNRCIEIGQKFDIPIVCKSTFMKNNGTTVSNKIEETKVKSIVKNDKVLYVNIKLNNRYMNILNVLTEKGILIDSFIHHNNYIVFTTKLDNEFKVKDLLENVLELSDIEYKNITKVSIIGYGIKNSNFIAEKTLDIIDKYNLNILNYELTESKLTLIFDKIIDDKIIELLHNNIFEK